VLFVHLCGTETLLVDFEAKSYWTEESVEMITDFA
jgi:hypothetical protein